jgi:drug/metabolite transporter (DMT)-like permease
LRNTIAGLILGALLAARGVPLPERSSWPGLALMGLLLLGLGNGCVVWAEQWVPSGVTAVVVATTPFWMVGLDAMLPSGERLTRRHLMGLVLGFLGILMLVWPDLRSTGAGSGHFLAGFVALQIACIGWTLGSAYSRRHARHENVLFAAAAQMAIGGAALLLLGTMFGEWPHLRFTMRTTSAFVYLIVLGSLVGFAAYVYALKYLPVATVSLYAYVNPVIAVVLGTLLLDEPFGPDGGRGVRHLPGHSRGAGGAGPAQTAGLRAAYSGLERGVVGPGLRDDRAGGSARRQFPLRRRYVK